MAVDIRIKRGAQADLPSLNLGEFGFVTDTKRLYIGDGVSNILIGQNVAYVQFPYGGLFEGETRAPGIATVGPVSGYVFDSSTVEYLYGSFRVPSFYRADTDIIAKIHWMNDSAQTGDNDVVWGIGYHTYVDTETYGSKTTTTRTVTDGPGNNAVAGTFTISSITLEYDDANNPLNASDVVSFRIYRDASNGSDDLTNDAALLLLTFEIETRNG